ncbi:MAG: hypothetical protein J3T61_06835 [Candidatus Brocadiales bacterium]|nr:hypothetical protein [Candidatus Bathyanammoxibius sp.]
MAKSVPVIGMEVVQRQSTLQIKLVEMTSSAEKLEVTDFVIEELQGGLKLVGPRLSKILQERGFKAKSINAIIPYPSIDYHQVSLPPMSKRDTRMAADREARKDLKFPADELVFDYEVVGESEEKGLQKIELVVARAQSKDMAELFSIAGESRLKLSSLTVVPAALRNLFWMRGGAGDETVAMVHDGGEKGTIVIFYQGNLRFPREFPLRRGSEADVSAERTGRLVAELKRSLLFAKQQARGLTVEKILLLGERAQPDALANAISSETGIQTEIYAPLDLDLSPLGDRVGEFRESLSTLAIPLGLAWNGHEHSTLNLMSMQLTEQRKSSLAKKILIAASILLIIFLAGDYFLLRHKVKPYKEELQGLNREIASLRPQTRDMQEIEKERGLLGTRRVFLGKMLGPVSPWSEILRTISLCVSDEMLLDSVDIKEDEKGWRLEIRGEVVGSDAAFVQRVFREFFSRLLTNPSLSDGVVESFTIGPTAVAGGARGTLASKLEFTVAAQIMSKEPKGGTKE